SSRDMICACNTRRFMSIPNKVPAIICRPADKMEKALSRENNFTFLRLFTALLVVYSHSFALTGNKGPSILGIDSGQFRVKAFFAICGYLVAKSWMSDPNILNYAIKRFLRIFPPFTVAILLTIFIIGPLTTTLPLGEYFSSAGTYRYFSNIFMYIRYH